MSRGSLISLKNRIHGIDTISSISKVMELISSMNFKKYKNIIDRADMRAEASKDIFKNLKYDYKGNKVNIIISSSKGMCGAYNSNIYKKINEDKLENILVVGKKAEEYLGRKQISFTSYSDNIEGMIDNLVSKILNYEIAEVNIIYTQYSHSKTKVLKEKIFPIEHKEKEIHYDQSSKDIFVKGIKIFLSSIINRSIVHSMVSENFSRMVSMKSANKNAIELIDRLKISYNKKRQSIITQEMLEVVNGAEQIEGDA